jgi:hypothetical protein
VNEKRGSHSVWPFVVIPAAMLAMKAMHRRRLMWEHGHGPGPAAGGWHGHRGWDRGSEAGARPADGFRLPPRIDSILTAWHERAHRAADSTESPSA